MRRVLSLFDHSGNWSRPYEEFGYDVTRIDLKHGQDILDTSEDWVQQNGPFHIVLAAPPCTHFSSSGAQYWPEKDADGRTRKAVELVMQVLRIVGWASPEIWAMENPVGRLNQLLIGLERWGPTYYNIEEYGAPYTKKTGLWGNFNRDLPRVKEVGDLIEDYIIKFGGDSERTKEARSETPINFAYAFFCRNL